ncbi:carboxymethylenebutenolidase homolog isoform X2 [Pituophis catenifer annectens]|uniref:carboxymethylenebutenolidase homolog isoform X2 n=1 Tax=Pituophis catenifer annectens TaxID=94852 RepID=UPI0039917D61
MLDKSENYGFEDNVTKIKDIRDRMAEKPKFCPCDLGDVFDYQPLGCEVSIEHIKAYVKKPSFQTDAAVLVIHDIFGGQLPNTRYIADLLASNGYITICPDFFRGEPWKPSDDISKLNEWLKTRDPKKIDREIDVVLKYLKEECNVTRIGVIGFCWGGSAVHHLMLNYSIFSVGVSIYGVVSLMEDNFNLKNPTFFIVAEKDEYIPLDQYTQVTKKLEQQCKVDFEVKIYPGQTHGFVHRKREDINPQDKPYIEEARRDMLAWLCKYI